MNSFLKIITQNSFFYSLNLALVAMVSFLLCAFSQADVFIWLNQFHNTLLKITFEIITFLGDGWFIIISSVLLLFIKKHRKLGFIILLSYISSGIFAQIIKNLIAAPRPKVFFELHHYKYYLDTFASSRIGFNSFPSGHTASFFAFATVLSNYCKRRYVCASLLFLSILVGYSRIYLAHHFLMDVFVGALIGVAFGSLSVIWYNKISESAFVKRKIESFKNGSLNFPNPKLSQQ
ncbi:phosphatase PAP2 family protein [Flavobacterium flavipallidum]|uniref:Phosphatase PAP2 family protein n=1 Tax=Flavobacterium flavipallidum TaxID=3139140 RepID=A0ABU9HI21_9FLAO